MDSGKVGRRFVFLAGLAAVMGTSVASAADSSLAKSRSLCVASTHFDELKNRDDIQADGGAAVNDAFLCQAFLDRRSSVCENVSVWLRRSGQSSGNSFCDENYFWLIVGVAAMKHDPQAVSLCLSGPSQDAPEQKKETCEYYVRAASNREFRGLCEHLSHLAGGDFNPDGCRRSTALLKALSSGSKSDCGSSILCEVLLSGSSALCSEVRRDAVERYCREKASMDQERRVHEEIKFRRENGLPPYKPGDKFFNELPGPERMKYEKRNRKAAPKNPTPAPESNPAP